MPVEASVEVPELVQESRRQHLVHAGVQPLVQNCRQKRTAALVAVQLKVEGGQEVVEGIPVNGGLVNPGEGDSFSPSISACSQKMQASGNLSGPPRPSPPSCSLCSSSQRLCEMPVSSWI